MADSSSRSPPATVLACALALIGAGVAGPGCQGGPGSQGAAGSSGSSQGVGAGSTGGSTGTASGTGTGGGLTFIDGGYVVCTASETADAGGASLVSWMCPAGTYVCGSPGSCAQCLSDADCMNQALPTFDPKRAHCDLDSGVRGYQGFCQQCLGNADCAGDPSGVQCDLDPSSAVAPIEAFGFETCAVLGLGCLDGTQAGLVRAGLLQCVSGTCATDQDCAGALVPGQPSFLSSQQPEPYCVAGQCSVAINPDFCPACYCSEASTCAGPVTSDAGEVCDPASLRCACTSSAQCGGFWPVCEILDGGDLLDGGDGLGACGCDRDDECGDGGLKCLSVPRTARTTAGPACALPCDDPRFPACAAVDAKTPVCDAASGLCVPCDASAGGAGDTQCQAQANEAFGGPLCRLDGTCGCATGADCRGGEACGGVPVSSSGGAVLGTCVSPPLPCTPESNGFCDWDSGVAGPNCLNDFQCGLLSRLDAFCDQESGECVECRDASDCVAIGLAASEGFTFCSRNACQRGCESDEDCFGNPGGPRCELPDSGARGTCSCRDVTDCPAAETCHVFPGSAAQCETGCTVDTDCGSGFFCDFSGACRARCDPGHSCQAPDLTCDRGNLSGFNGLGYAGSVAGAVWCYPCVDASQCTGGLGCGASTGFACGACGSDKDCSTGEICGVSDSLCHATCQLGACPAGQVCDSLALAANGVNLCYECLSAADCSGGEGCDSRTHTCGACEGPTADGGSFDCAPGAVCSNYWLPEQAPGVCVQNCDRLPCPTGEKCAVFGALTLGHSYCFGCTQDSDCADAGPRAWCDTSVGLTFTCRVPAG